MNQGHQTSSHPSFSASEVESFHEADRHGAAAIVGLMVGIFTLGLVMYIVVALMVNAERYPAAG